MHDTAILIGRFQPFHAAHLALLRTALACASKVVVIVGSAHQPRTPRNPFTWQEREAMLRAALTEQEGARLKVLPVRDYYNEKVWAQAVRTAVERVAVPGGRIALVGHVKQDSSSYLQAFPGWELVGIPQQGNFDATGVRNAYFGASPDDLAAALAPLAHALPPTTYSVLEQFARTPHYAALQEEWRMLRDYRASWAGAPYTPIFVTVDALVRCQNQVLLIRRGRAPGRGLRALPGGFIEPRETLWKSCLRELEEETHCAVSEEALRTALRAVTVFDHPDRSQRGRTITHVHYFDFGDAPLPSVRADDDAAQVEWIPIEQLAGLEETFFEDHFHVLNQFLQLVA